MKSGRHAMSLPELLVGAAVFSMALTVMTGLLIFCLQNFRREDPRGTTQRLLLKSINQLCAGYRDTATGSVTLVYPSGSPAQGDLAMSIYSTHDMNGSTQEEGGTGLATYPASIVYFRQASDNTLRRIRTNVPAPPTAPTAMLAADLLAHMGSAPSEVLAPRTTSFQALDFDQELPTDVPSRRLWLRLEMTSTAGDRISLSLPAMMLKP
jgi:hypothetical protein